MKKYTNINKNLIVINIIIMLIVIIIFIGVMPNKQEKERKGTIQEKMVNVPFEKNEKKDLNKAFKEGFIEGCTEDKTVSYSVCACAYDQLEREYGQKELINIALTYATTEELPERAINSMLKCIE